jgi:hypothetical protein
MKFRNIIGLFVIALSFNACWIGDHDDIEVESSSTVIQVLCQNGETTLFCDLAYRGQVYTYGTAIGAPVTGHVLGQARAGGVDPVTGERCVSEVKTVFAPSDSAFLAWLEDFPQWETVYDIPADTVDLILRHHIFLGKKLFVQIENTVCSERQIVFGNANPYKMWAGGFWIFAVSPGGDVFPLSLETGDFADQAIFTPDMTTSDGVVYVISKVLAPF